MADNENPTSVPIKTDGDSRSLESPPDLKDVKKLLQKIQDMTIFQAKIKKKSDDHADEYTALIFTSKSANEDDAIYKGIKIYEPDFNNTYDVNAWVEVILDGNMVGLIVPRRLPKGTGRCKVLMLVDDSDPGTPDWDYWRFQE